MKPPMFRVGDKVSFSFDRKILHGRIIGVEQGENEPVYRVRVSETGLVEHLGESFLSMFNPMSKQMKKGIRIESEHRSTYNKVKKLAKKGKYLKPRQFYGSIAGEHIAEDKLYYEHLKNPSRASAPHKNPIGDSRASVKKANVFFELPVSGNKLYTYMLGNFSQIHIATVRNGQVKVIKIREDNPPASEKYVLATSDDRMIIVHPLKSLKKVLK